MEAGATNIVPVWLTNSGMESTTVSLTYEELSSILNVAAADAKDFAKSMFKEMEERRKKKGEGG